MGLLEPKGIKYHYVDENEEWQIREDAPEWAKEEFKEFMKSVNPEPDENGIITQA